MSDCERFDQIAQDKLATVSSGRSEEMSNREQIAQVAQLSRQMSDREQFAQVA